MTVETSSYDINGRCHLKISGAIVIRTDYYADLVLFDPQEIPDMATFDEPEVPAAGIEMVIVNGTPTWKNGAHSGERPGLFICS